MNKRYLMAGLLALVAVTPAFAQQTEKPVRVLNVNGVGTVQRQPDRAVILVAVESRAVTAQEAAQTNARKMDAVFAALRKVGIVPPNVATVSYALQPEYREPDPRSATPNTPRVVGYLAMNTVRVQVDSMPRVGAVIDATVAAGANRIENLSFELKDMESARLEALKLAVLQARGEAEVLAAAAGQKLGEPQSITSSSAWMPMPQYRMRAEVGMVAAAPAPTPVEAGSLSVTANVSITYLLEAR